MYFLLKCYLGFIISFSNLESTGQEEDLGQRTSRVFRPNIPSPSFLMRSDSRYLTVWRKMAVLQNSEKENVTEDTSWRTWCRPIQRAIVIQITSDKLTAHARVQYDVLCLQSCFKRQQLTIGN